jgi:soluble lytic murein transglycosylase-like protein
VAAVIEVESAGNAHAYSNSGAVGLMQIMPRDGLASQFQCINGPCFAGRPSMDELYEPAFNISYGSRYLAGLISRSEGDLRQALMGYGPKDMGYTYADLVLNKYQQYQQ